MNSYYEDVYSELDFTEWKKFTDFIDNIEKPKGIIFYVINASDEYIQRRRINIEDVEISVIFGLGTYGYRIGRIEYWDYRESDPRGDYKADTIIKMIQDTIDEEVSKHARV